ncbi:hypothetical protein M9Y10_042783 [Tritrichomonas musculus]|uniref:Uncharacterized protein n=1 Tax=Tritrichomonas musculus TaxID=1915356 RepID=A0ABR2JYZ8_9EUKA
MKNLQYFTGDECHFRLGIFLTNFRLIQEFNSNKKSYKVGLNQFSCYTSSEYKSLLGYKQISIQLKHQQYPKLNDDIPDFIDWREKGIVNEIKDQGFCGSCWAFGTIQACESSYASAQGTLNSCSEQNLIDCCTDCDGCGGGVEYKALDFIINSQNGYLNSEDVYPYIADDGECKYDQTKGISPIKSYSHGIKDDEIYLKKLVSKGVCDIAIDAGFWDFQAYTSGIYANPDCTSASLNHAVGLVGYGTENGIDYWIVRNSWRKNWGDERYIKMILNKNNQCGVASDALQVYA